MTYTPITCPHCGEEDVELREGSFRFVVSHVIQKDDGTFDVNGEYDVDWENGYELERRYSYACCGEFVKERDLLDRLYEAFDAPDRDAERETAIRILGYASDREPKGLDTDIAILEAAITAFTVEEYTESEYLDSMVKACERIVRTFNADVDIPGDEIHFVNAERPAEDWEEEGFIAGIPMYKYIGDV